MNLPLVVRPDIQSIDDLRGKTLAVDTPVTAFAFVLYRMLEEAGLERDDYEIVEAGATIRRWQGLRAGEFHGTVLADGLSQQAVSEGFNILANSLSVLGAYQGTVFAANEAWAEQNADTLTRFTAAILDALDWLYDDRNADRAAEILAQHMDMPLPSARRAVSGLKGAGGLTRDGSILQDGVDVVLELRRRYGIPRKTLRDADAYVDTTYYDAARRTR
jgi:ABC-type nitrate/sulfonate/bicarbonate transport system substrate-binding protein